MQLINTIDGVKNDLLQEGRRLARLNEKPTYCLIHGTAFGHVTTRVDVAERLIQEGYKLYAKFNKEGDLVL